MIGDRKEYSKKYYQEHKTEKKFYTKKWLMENKERTREYKEKNRIEIKNYHDKYYLENKELMKIQITKKKRERMEKLRTELLIMYGSKCNCPGCKEARPVCLTLDHTQNDGYRNRKEGRNTEKEWKTALENYNPSTYQILCYNCNCGKNKNGGTCPHLKMECEDNTPSRYKKYRSNLRAKFFEMYGKICVLCGENNSVFLTLDHVKDNGRENGKRKSGRTELLKATRQYNPQEYQVLCFNCNCTKGKT
jgi:hypothetical protein